MSIYTARLLALLVLIVGFGKGILPGQDLDAIQEAINNAGEDKAKVELLIESSRDISTNHPTEALEYADEALKLSQKLRFRIGVVNSYSNLGLVYMNQDKYTQARQNL
ncbi:MAG: tetratricopeptide repeat protein, partial [Bacteroidota bacterium]